MPKIAFSIGSGTFIVHVYNAKLPSPYVKEKGRTFCFIILLVFSTSLC